MLSLLNSGLDAHILQYGSGFSVSTSILSHNTFSSSRSFLISNCLIDCCMLYKVVSLFSFCLITLWISPSVNGCWCVSMDDCNHHLSCSFEEPKVMVLIHSCHHSRLLTRCLWVCAKVSPVKFDNNPRFPWPDKGQVISELLHSKYWVIGYSSYSITHDCSILITGVVALSFGAFYNSGLLGFGGLRLLWFWNYVRYVLNWVLSLHKYKPDMSLPPRLLIYE